MLNREPREKDVLPQRAPRTQSKWKRRSTGMDADSQPLGGLTTDSYLVRPPAGFLLVTYHFARFPFASLLACAYNRTMDFEATASCVMENKSWSTIRGHLSIVGIKFLSGS